MSSFLSSKTLSAAALMSALTAAGAFLRIPLPYVPLTLQTTFVCLSGIWLGPLGGALSQIAYLAAGLIGFPVFAGGGGLHYLLEPTFGYLLGFAPAAFAAGLLASAHPSYTRCLLAVFAGLLLIYLPGIGVLFLNLKYLVGRQISLGEAVGFGLAPLPKDLVMAPLTALLARQVKRQLPFRRCSGT